MTPGPTTDGSVGAIRPSIQHVSALVIGLDTCVGLLTCRTLARRGVRVVGLAADRHHPSCWTNTCHRLVITPTAGPRLLEALEALAGPEAGAVLFPCTDAAVSTLVHAREHLHAYRTALPSAEIVEEVTDRRRFATLAREAGIAVPASMLVTDRQSARQTETRARQTETRERYAGSCYISPRGLPILTFVSRHLRRSRDPLGLWGVDEAIDDPMMRELTMAVMSSVPFVGLGTVEAERDPSSGDLRVLHVTVGRPSYRSTMAETAGVELLYTMYRDAIGAPLPVDRRQHDRPAMRARSIRSLRTSFRAVRRGQLTPSAWMRSLRRPHPPSSFDLADPLPSVAAGAGRVWQRIGHPSRHVRTPRSGRPAAATPGGSEPDRVGA
jgi:predicted ATP-grasp superfamily ATP-dependent carboligase